MGVCMSTAEDRDPDTTSVIELVCSCFRVQESIGCAICFQAQNYKQSAEAQFLLTLFLPCVAIDHTKSAKDVKKENETKFGTEH